MRHILLIALTLFAAGCERREAPRVAAAPAVTSRDAAPQADTPRPAPRDEARPAPAAIPPAPADAPTDASITGRLRTALVGDPGMAGADVSINTDHGVVVLSGTVITHEQAGIASAHAQRQDGVMRVDNQLRPAVS